MKPPFKVRLASVGNPDFGQDPSRRLYGAEPNRTASCTTLEEAVELCMEFISANDLGGGNWSGGRVTDATGKAVAQISYNGSLWDYAAYKKGELQELAPICES